MGILEFAYLSLGKEGAPEGEQDLNQMGVEN